MRCTGMGPSYYFPLSTFVGPVALNTPRSWKPPSKDSWLASGPLTDGKSAGPQSEAP